MENPTKEDDESARFQMLAQRRTPGPSDLARSQNSVHNNRIENVTANQNYGNLMRDTITVECQNLNGTSFNGRVNFIKDHCAHLAHM